MGSFFSAPKPPPPPPPPPPVADASEEERKLRLESLTRRRRGRAGMILTSERGLGASNAQPAKTLLGE